MERLVLEVLLAIGVALCPLGIVVLLIWFVVSVAIPINRRLTRLRRLRTSPCDRCLYFNRDDELHCAVQPYLVLTKHARDCRDFERASQSSRTWGTGRRGKGHT